MHLKRDPAQNIAVNDSFAGFFEFGRRCFLAFVLVVASHFHQLVVIFADCFQRRCQRCRHLTANFAVRGVFTAFRMQHFLRFRCLRQVVVDHFGLLENLRLVDISLANDAHVTLDALDLHAQHLRFRLGNYAVNCRGLGCVPPDASRIILSMLNISRSPLIRPEAFSIVSGSFVVNSRLSRRRLGGERTEREHGGQGKSKQSERFCRHLQGSVKKEKLEVRFLSHSPIWMLDTSNSFRKFRKTFVAIKDARVCQRRTRGAVTVQPEGRVR